jgi:MFS transporter, PPP family, 3-phenylpropionic acid transporter
MNKKDKILTVKYSGLQASYWFINVAVMVFMILFLRNRGFSDASIGVLQMIKYLMSVVSQMVISNLVDKHRDRITLKQVICIMCFLGFVTTVILIIFHMGFVGTAICFAIFGGTINGVYPYINTLATSYAEAGRNLLYNFARGIGALTWALGSIIISLLVNALGIECILWIQAIMLAALFAGTLAIDNIRKPQKKAGRNSGAHTYLDLFAGFPHYTLFLISSIFLFIATNLQTTYMTDVVARLGGGNTELGYIEFLIAMYEVLASFLFTRINKLFKIETILKLCPVFALMQSLSIQFAPNLVSLAILNAFYIFGVGIFWTTSVKYVMKSIPLADWTKGQALANVASVGIGGIIGSLLGGYIIENYGVYKMLMLSSFSVVISIFFMFKAMSIGKNNKTIALEQR